MKLKFKHQPYQARAVEAVVDCFKGQPKKEGLSYRIDPGVQKAQPLDTNLSLPGFAETLEEGQEAGFKNAEVLLNETALLENIHDIQHAQNLPQSETLIKSKVCPINLDVEMETGTGKTYCYIKTAFEMNERYGWSKFIIVVPSIAIREGVAKSLEITEDHFFQDYGKKARFFIYNSKQLHKLETFSSDGGINIMIINVQAFNAKGADARRIYGTPRTNAKGETTLVGLDDFQSRRPIDVIKANRPILIIDEPQKIEGDAKKASKSFESLKEFKPLMILRYSATHKKLHNKVHRLDALDAYNQKLVKKIAVRGISVKGLSGTNAYLYLSSIEVSTKAPVARLEFEIKQASGNIKRITRKISKGYNLFVQSNELEQYQGYTVSDINAITDTISFTNGVELTAGEATGDVNEASLRRIQIRETIKAHFAKEEVLFNQGIKVLSLFFIDEVAKYRVYGDEGDSAGEYAKIFEEEYEEYIKQPDLPFNPEYKKYLDSIAADKTHNGYFSKDKKGKMIDSKEKGRGDDKQCDDVAAYDLILKDKERLLSFKEPTRFIFSHSALREGWDNPNVFVICTLKHSDNTISRRQEVGRGLRICVNQQGERQDHPATVHQTNVLTVVASESYKDFVTHLQKDISETLSARPKVADVKYFTGKILQTESGPVEINSDMAEGIEFYLIQNGYVGRKKNITQKYHDAVKEQALAPLPEDLQNYQEQVFQLVDSVFSEAGLPKIDNDRNHKPNVLNSNFEKQEFKELWERINRKAAYSVHFNSEELVKKCISTLDSELKVAPLRYSIERGEQSDDISYDDVTSGASFEVRETENDTEERSIHSAVKYDLVGKIAGAVKLTRRTVASILGQMNSIKFGLFKINPEAFIAEVSRLINEQKATCIIEHLSYDATTETHGIDIFTDGQSKQDFSKAGEKLKRHIYDYVITDSGTERTFVEKLDTSSEVVVYAKLPNGFFIPTPVGDYNPDWAIAFKEGTVKHVYFVAETKGSMSTMDLREIEKTKIACARKFFTEINEKINPKNVKYDVVNSYDKLIDIVGVGG